MGCPDVGKGLAPGKWYLFFRWLPVLPRANVAFEYKTQLMKGYFANRDANSPDTIFSHCSAAFGGDWRGHVWQW